MWNDNGTKIIEGDSTVLYSHAITGIPGLVDGGVSVYPNPAKGRFTVGTNSTINAIEIYSLSGKRVYSDYNFNKQSTKDIDLSAYAKGVYFLKAISGTKVYTRKVIVH
jgi:hypothetical protein